MLEATKSRRGKQTIGETTGCVAPETAGRPHVYAVRPQNWAVGFNVAQARIGRAKCDTKDLGTAL